jgi:hypothetical protein
VRQAHQPHRGWQNSDLTKNTPKWHYKKGIIMAKAKQYVYIVQSSKETNVCKIGITDNYQRRLKDYNNMTSKSKDTVFKYLFVCEVKDMVLETYYR